MAALSHYRLLCTLAVLKHNILQSQSKRLCVNTVSKYSGGDRHMGDSKADRARVGFRDCDPILYFGVCRNQCH